METTSLHVLGDGRDTAPVVRPQDDAAALPAEGDVLLGKYEIERTLGAGGMGVVLAARHLALGERVAIKLLRPAAVGQTLAVARFLREARALARLKNEHVARVMDVGTLPSGAPYMGMELLAGNDLAEEIASRGALPAQEAVEYVRQACRAMAEAHALGIVHRDLKPANLFLHRPAGRAPVVKVIDFGIAKTEDGLMSGDVALTAGTVVLGSPAYMSPEQVRAAGEVDARSDVWALGVILHELVSGRPPFEAATPAALLAAVAADPPARLREEAPGAPAALEGVILRCLEKNVDRRIQSATALEAELARIAAGAAEPEGDAEPEEGTESEEEPVSAGPAARAGGRGRGSGSWVKGGAAVVGVAALSALWVRAGGPVEGTPAATAAESASSTASIHISASAEVAASAAPAAGDALAGSGGAAASAAPVASIVPVTTSAAAVSTGAAPARPVVSATAAASHRAAAAGPAPSGQRPRAPAKQTPETAGVELPGGDVEAATARRK